VANAIQQLPARQLEPLLRAYSDAVQRRRWLAVGVGCVFVVCATLAFVGAEINLATFWTKLGGFPSYFNRILTLDSGQRVWTDPAEWFWGLKKWLALLGETILMAYVATILGALGAFVSCFLAAEKISRAPWLAMVVRRFLEICRTVPDLVFALIFVVAFGLGPMPGVLALAIHTMGALGKMFGEVVDNIDMKPVDGLRSAGAGFVQTIRFAALPQVLSNFAGYALLRFEINVRGATVMGFVGAGGIGVELLIAVRKFYYSDVSAILALVICAVFFIDILTSKLRERLVDMERPS